MEVIFKAGPSVISLPTFQQTGPLSPSLGRQSFGEGRPPGARIPHVSHAHNPSQPFIQKLNGSDSSTSSATPSHAHHRADDEMRQDLANLYPRGYGAQNPPAKRCCQILRRYALAFISQLKAHRNLGTPPAKRIINLRTVPGLIWVCG